jgi:hypothetical protein
VNNHGGKEAEKGPQGIFMKGCGGKTCSGRASSVKRRGGKGPQKRNTYIGSAVCGGFQNGKTQTGEEAGKSRRQRREMKFFYDGKKDEKRQETAQLFGKGYSKEKPKENSPQPIRPDSPKTRRKKALEKYGDEEGYNTRKKTARKEEREHGNAEMPDHKPCGKNRQGGNEDKDQHKEKGIHTTSII